MQPFHLLSFPFTFMQKAEAGGIELAPAAKVAGEAPTEEKPALSPANSIQNDKVICLECGAEIRQLSSKHLVSHGMNQKSTGKIRISQMRTPLGGKISDQSKKQSGKEEGIA